MSARCLAEVSVRSSRSLAAPCSVVSSLPILAVALGLAGCGVEEETPDGTWKVTVSSALDDDNRLASDCVESASAYSKTYDYQLFVSESAGEAVELKIAGESFATGQRQGCSLAYQSPVWREDRDGGVIQWQITGEATYQGRAGGCELPNGLDWQGTELITVIDSDVESVPRGCTYLMETEGVLTGGG